MTQTTPSPTVEEVQELLDFVQEAIPEIESDYFDDDDSMPEVVVQLSVEDMATVAALCRSYLAQSAAPQKAGEPISIMQKLHQSDEEVELSNGDNWAIIYARNGEKKIWRIYPTEDEARESPALKAEYGTRLVKIIPEGSWHITNIED